MYLNTSIPLDSCLSQPLPPPPSCHCVFWLAKTFYVAERKRKAGKAKDIRKAQIMRCQAGQTIIVNYIYSSAFGIQPWCFQEYKVVPSTCSRLSLVNGNEWSLLKLNNPKTSLTLPYKEGRQMFFKKDVQYKVFKLNETLVLLKWLKSCLCAISLLHNKTSKLFYVNWNSLPGCLLWLCNVCLFFSLIDTLVSSTFYLHLNSSVMVTSEGN